MTSTVLCVNSEEKEFLIPSGHRLVGFYFRNHYSSILTLEVKVGQEVVSQSLVLNEQPHFQDKAQERFTITLDKSFSNAVDKLLSSSSSSFGLEKHQGREGEDRLIRINFVTRQSSPLWRHKAHGVRDVEPVMEQEEANREREEPRSSAQLQVAVDQVAIHLGVLEALWMRKKRVNST